MRLIRIFMLTTLLFAFMVSPSYATATATSGEYSCRIADDTGSIPAIPMGEPNDRDVVIQIQILRAGEFGYVDCGPTGPLFGQPFEQVGYSSYEAKYYAGNSSGQIYDGQDGSALSWLPGDAIITHVYDYGLCTNTTCAAQLLSAGSTPTTFLTAYSSAIGTEGISYYSSASSGGGGNTGGGGSTSGVSIVNVIVSALLAGVDALTSLLPTLDTSTIDSSTPGGTIASHIGGMNQIFPLFLLLQIAVIGMGIRLLFNLFDLGVWIYHQFWGSD